MPRAIGQRRLMFVLRVLATLGNNSDSTTLHQKIATDIELEGKTRLDDIQAYVNDRLCNRIYLEDAAALINMSVPTFCRFFKQWTGRKFVNFVQEARIEREIGR